MYGLKSNHSMQTSTTAVQSSTYVDSRALQGLQDVHVTPGYRPWKPRASAAQPRTQLSVVTHTRPRTVRQLVKPSRFRPRHAGHKNGDDALTKQNVVATKKQQPGIRTSRLQSDLLNLNQQNSAKALF